LKRQRLVIAACALWLGAAAAAAPEPVTVEVQISGVEGGLRENVEAMLGVYKERDSERLTAARLIALHERAGDQIRKALEALGHYHVTIEASLRRPEGEDEDAWRARYVIDPGEPVRIRRLELRVLGAGAEDPAFAAVIEAAPLAPGKVLDHGAYESLKAGLARLAAERGYFDARFTRTKVAVHRAEHAADVQLHYDTGERYHFGQLRLPETVIQPEMLRRYADIPAGDPYLSARLIELQQTLIDTDIFQSVQVQPQEPDRAEKRVPVSVELTPRPPQKYSIGAGFGTDTGIRARGAYERRYLFGRGHRANVDLRLSAVSSSLVGRYTIPYRDPRVDRLGLSLGVLNEDTDASSSQRIDIGVSNTTQRWGWQETASLEYQLEQFEVGEETETTGTLLPGLRWTRTWADNRIYADNGLRLSFGVLGSHTALLSDVSFLRLDANAKWIHRLNEDARVLARGALGGAVVSDFDDLPATQRFFAGGDNSVRGFDFRSLGPRDAQGEIIGGRYLAVASLEYEHRIKGKWSGAVFTDAGNAFDDFGDPFEYSVGAGLRWLSPVGLLRLDLAVGVSDDDLPVRLHIVVGPDF